MGGGRSIGDWRLAIADLGNCRLPIVDRRMTSGISHRTNRQSPIVNFQNPQSSIANRQ
jgi:hypothetical protein